MSGVLIASWAGVGFVAGPALVRWAECLLTSVLSIPRAWRLAGFLPTGVVFGVLGWRFGHQFDLLPYSYLAAVGVALAVIDLAEHRLPTKLVLPSVAALCIFFVISAVLRAEVSGILRALVGMVALAAFYLVVALASGGGLGAGDVKLGGLLGLALGWQGWSAIVAGTFLGWFAAALMLMLLRAARRQPLGGQLPMGPFLLFGAFLAISLSL